MPSIFLTGAGGVLGRAVRRQLREKNFGVVCYDRSRSPQSDQGLDGAANNWIQGDILDWSHLSKSMKDSGCDYVVHLAALVASNANSHPRDGIQVNVSGTANVAEAARAIGCKGIVYISSRSVYGNVGKAYAHPNYGLVPETYRCRPEALYPMTKRAAEMVIERYAALYKLPAVMLRFGAIYGPGKSAGHGATRVFSEAIEAAARGATWRIGGADQLEDFVYSEDIPEAVLSAVMLLANGEKSRSAQIFNIGSGVGVSIRKFAEIVNEATGVTLTLDTGVGVMQRDYRQSFVMNNQRAQQILQYRLRHDLPAGIEHYVSTFKQEALQSNNLIQ